MQIDGGWFQPSPTFVDVDDASRGATGLFEQLKLLHRSEPGIGSLVFHCFVHRRHGAAGI
jgi:hypothetical protein